MNANPPKIRSEKVDFVHYMETADRDDRNTLCVHIETPDSWTSAEIARHDLASVRRNYRQLEEMFREATKPNEEMRYTFRSWLFEAMRDGVWMNQGAMVMSGAWYICDEVMTRSMLTPDKISGFHILLSLEDGVLTTDVHYYLRAEAIAPGEGQHRHVVVRFN
jgi:hypothetical protein